MRSDPFLQILEFKECMNDILRFRDFSGVLVFQDFSEILESVAQF